MHKISIKPQWTLGRREGAALPARLIDLLVQVHEHGSLAAACQQLGLSYRHAWDLVRQGEAVFGTPLLHMARGKGSRLTALADKLVWADRRIAARLAPTLDSLASELEIEIRSLLDGAPARLRIHASHGFAVEALLQLLEQQPLVVERKYCNSHEALAALAEGVCDIAGFHVPVGEFEAIALAHHARWLDARTQRVMPVALRRQGLIVAPGNPQKIYSLADLTRPALRFVNRQAGSGTRFLLDQLLQQAGLTTDRINGYEQVESTHAAVAAYVASGLADAAFGVEPPARQYGLDFVPLATERYVLLCQQPWTASAQFESLHQVLAGADFAAAVNRLPGYVAAATGQVLDLPQAFASVSA